MGNACASSEGVVCRKADAEPSGSCCEREVDAASLRRLARPGFPEGRASGADICRIGKWKEEEEEDEEEDADDVRLCESDDDLSCALEAMPVAAAVIAECVCSWLCERNADGAEAVRGTGDDDREVCSSRAGELARDVTRDVAAET